MKKDIILAGVGGQGILSIATIIGEAATQSDLYLKQAEVHGMSQRGGDVQSNLRLSNAPIYSDLIPKGRADMIIAMEPMEALRYVDCLAEDATVVTSSHPFVNIADYPEDIQDQIARFMEVNPGVNFVQADIEELAKENKIPRSANVILLGMAAGYLGILTADQLREAVGRVFASKGDAIVEANYKAFDLGLGVTHQE